MLLIDSCSEARKPIFLNVTLKIFYTIFKDCFPHTGTSSFVRRGTRSLLVSLSMCLRCSLLYQAWATGQAGVGWACLGLSGPGGETQGAHTQAGPSWEGGGPGETPGRAPLGGGGRRQVLRPWQRAFSAEGRLSRVTAGSTASGGWSGCRQEGP